MKHKCSTTCGACNRENYEQGDIDFLKSHATKDSIFLDVGAHAGLYTVQLAPLVKQVIAVEPITDDVLYSNTAQFENVFILKAAAWSEPAQLGVEYRANGQSFIAGDGSLPGIPLDIFRAKRLLFKIDVEGSAFHVLKGMRSLLITAKEIAGVIEVDPNHMTRFNSNPSQIAPHLQGLVCVSDKHKNHHYKKGL